MSERRERLGAIVAFLLLAASLIPVAYLGRYNHATGDDYYYGVEAHLAWEETGSVMEVIKAALTGVAQDFGQWQGTYTALFFMRIPPNAFSEDLYRFVTVALLLLFTGSVFYLMKSLICGLLGGSRNLWVLISSLLSLLCVQTVPSQGETFFWYNGSMYYTGYFSVTLLFLGIAVRYLQKPRKYHIPLLAVLAAFLGGGNYVSLLPCLILLTAAWVLLLLKKDRRAWGMGTAAFVLLIGLLVSASAPGNQIRQSGMWSIPAWKAILKSLLQGFRYLEAWMGKWWLLTALVLTPAFLRLCRKRRDIRFEKPVLVLGFLYGVFCSMSCPTFYTMNSTGPARAIAIVYYGFILFSFMGYFYLLGYVIRKVEGAAGESVAAVIGAVREKLPWLCFAPLFGAAFLLVVQAAGGKLEDCTTVKAITLLANGQARAYEQEYQERMQLLLDDSLQEVVLSPYENRPDMLYVGDFSSDPNEETCRKAAQYFKKTAVSVGEPPQEAEAP